MLCFQTNHCRSNKEQIIAMSTEDSTITLPAPGSTTKAQDADIFPHVDFDQPRQAVLAWRDVKEGFQKWRIWTMLAYQDIRLRYRRSIIGPFWITLSMAITIYVMGYLYSHIFHVDLEIYFPYVAGGMLTWALISTLVLELTDGLATADAMIKQIKLPYTLYMHRIVCRNMFILFHNILVMIPILIIFHRTAPINVNTLLLIPGLFVLYINAIIYGLILSMLGARYRDISQIIRSLVQIVFFVTPVIWRIDALSPKNQIYLNLNPFYAFLELIRAPLLGTTPTMYNFINACVITIAGLIVSIALFTKYRARIVYWI